jgi:hypothetical protein
LGFRLTHAGRVLSLWWILFPKLDFVVGGARIDQSVGINKRTGRSLEIVNLLFLADRVLECCTVERIFYRINNQRPAGQLQINFFPIFNFHEKIVTLPAPADPFRLTVPHPKLGAD